MFGRKSKCTAIVAVSLFLLLPSIGQAEASKYEKIEGVVFSKKDDKKLLADVYMPITDGLNPSVLLIHGGGWMAGNRRELSRIARKMAPLGYTVVAIDYRLAPEDKFPAQIEDCNAALNWMVRNAAKFKIDTSRIGVWGYSAGGHLAALLGTTNNLVRAVVAGGAPCDFSPIRPDNQFLSYWLGGTPREMPETYKKASPTSFISEDDPPFFFYHGQTDFLVPISQPKRMIEGLKRPKYPSRCIWLKKRGMWALCEITRPSYSA